MAKNNVIQSVTSAVPTGTFSPTASSLAGWDASSNLSANSIIEGYATTATAAGTTTLTVSDKQQQYFTGSTTQTVLLPVTSTLVNGQSFEIRNLSSGNVTVQSSGGNTLQAMTQNTVLIATVVSTSGTGTASWSFTYNPLVSAGGTVTIAGDSGSMTGSSLTINGGSTGLTTTASGTSMSITGTLGVANGGTAASSFTAYAPITGGTTSTGALQSADSGISNSGYVLKSTGSSSLPTWQNPFGTSALTLIQSQTASAGTSSLTFTTNISSTYSNYLLVFDNVIGSTTGLTLAIQLSSDGGSTYISSSYQSGYNSFPYNSTTLTNTNSTSRLLLCSIDSTLTKVAGQYSLLGLTDGAYPGGTGMAVSETGIIYVVVGTYQVATAMNAFQIVPSSGTFQGTFTLYGYRLT